ncbi:TetR family transcriptional regulator [Rhodococcus triatomae]|uniref:DNA-binding transcriptional regulator, AcrR family n=1 Tax=Rhodococcus triatomae TaxID=300028 RepID=A0A1G8P1R3_9NOCA|nr:TetR family transcriptional regulator C-terminal domain-containing protein [Rhodococcus triatomae]QNG18776.1 TetR family transcriptional regulator [Rhodococcus triatomae]QNG25313.1 TetR family transcriptional regulator [Rhodococcus triatomae]SDI86275.1 DNA-binding transcriptional regulator, AcrR family [Rhodococcus triatomae]
MTRHADAATRRSQITDALLGVVADLGLQRTTLTDVATRAGVSVGMVQRYFRNKDELLRFGIAHVFERAEQRVLAIEPARPLRNYVGALMRTVLPLDAERERELRFWLNFLHVALTDTETSATHERATAGLLDGVTRALSAARQHGELARETDPVAEASALVAFVDGLCLHHALAPAAFPTRSLEEALETYLDRLFLIR